MKPLLDWLDHRTGCRDVLHETLYERIPGGARWRYVWGSTLVFTFTVQVITGIFLWMSYSPSAQSAWESVYYIQHEMTGGWLLRGIHHYTAQAMVVLLGLHLMQVVIDGAYKAPREINFWLGLVLMQLVLGLALTGYLLPWDQKGYWATRVATNIAGIVPVIGPALQRVVVGGPDYGHHTLTRFFALHAGVLPGLLIAFLVLHVSLFRRHGITAKTPYRKPDSTFWPDQVLMDSVACLAVLLTVLAMVFWLGAELGAPADPAKAYAAARPEWYFLFLFQMLKYFPGEAEVFGAVILPGIVMLVLVLMPLLGKWKLGHGFNIGFTFALLIGAVGLTGLAMREDRGNADYAKAVLDAKAAGERAAELAARHGIPPTGAVTLLRNDPLTQGPTLFAQHCASCHSHKGGRADDVTAAESSAPNLFAFGSEAWILGLLDPAKIDGPEYFGATKHKEGDMSSFVHGDLPELGKQKIDAVAYALAAEGGHIAKPDQAKLDEGRAVLNDADTGCAVCHKFHDAGELGSAPDLTGYGSQAWLEEFISNPEAERFYPSTNDRMPAFGQNRLTPVEISLLARWLRGDE